MASRLEQEAGYKLSRAALRDRYGSRAIDASAPQSAQDQTPSGRQKFLEQQNRKLGLGPQESANKAVMDRNAEFGAAFPFRLESAVGPRMSLNPVTTPLFSAPPKPLGLLPESTEIASIPSSVSPLGGFQLPTFRNGLLQKPNQWTSRFG